MSLRYCLNVHGEMLCDGPQGHEGGCRFTLAWELVRRIEDDYLSLVAYAGDTTNELRDARTLLREWCEYTGLRGRIRASEDPTEYETGRTLLARTDTILEGSEQVGNCSQPHPVQEQARDGLPSEAEENAAWWISHDGKRRLRAVTPHQGDYEPPEVDDWRPGDYR